MNRHNNPPLAKDYLLRPGFIYMTDRSIAISTVLGSSVSICLFDKKRKIGGMNHFLYPDSKTTDRSTPRYGDIATLALARMMRDNGSKSKHLEAQIFGGAHNPDVSAVNIGQKNITCARRILKKLKIKVISEDVGGEVGRKIIFNTSSCEIAILKVPSLRQSDWYPYESDR